MYSQLNMSSARPVDDITARARIRDAAVLRFGRDGFDTSVRAIAADAGVSPGLVIHHFRTKERLREECDRHVLDAIKRAKHEGIEGSRRGRLLEHLAEAERYAPELAYVMRSLQQGGPLAKAFVEHMIEDAVEYIAEAVEAGLMHPSRDELARARYLVLSSVGASLLSITLDPPDDPSDIGAMMRRHVETITLPALELFTEGAFATRQLLDEYLAHVHEGDRP